MTRLFRNSCEGFLAILIFGLVAILSVLAVTFQQSQAVHSNRAATLQAKATPTRRLVLPPASPPAVPSQDALDGDVTIQIQTTTPIPTQTVAPTTNYLGTPTLVSTNGVEGTGTEVPRYSGTSSYPLTVTAEVELGLTHVANYQAGVAATRTAIAAESASIYATLTAAAPTVSAP